MKTSTEEGTRLTEGASRRAEYTAKRLSFWQLFGRESGRWRWIRHQYQGPLTHIYKLLIPPGMRVLELGCGEGDLLHAVRPSYGVGVDFSSEMIQRATATYPDLTFLEADVHTMNLEQTFDYIICADLVNDVWDVQEMFEAVARHCHAGTRVIVNAYSHLWEWPRHIAEALGLVVKQLPQNWLTPSDISDLLFLAGFDTLRAWPEILCPIRIPGLDAFANRFLVKLWPFSWLALSNFLIARPRPSGQRGPEPVVTVVVPARNEEGNVPDIFARVPHMGAGTDLIFVEGNSTDNTYAAIQDEITRYPAMRVRLLKQPGKGKGDAVRAGFAVAEGDLLMILDADLTVPPEDLPKFYQAWRSGADFVNGVRLVYPMEDKAMRFLNLLGNKFFGLTFSWLLSQSIKDTLCGTKVLSKRDYEMIAANRGYFGKIDPFGDFDLIFGAAKYNLKIVGVPIRYRERTYGDTNIQRWKHGVLLLRMALKAMFKIKFV